VRAGLHHWFRTPPRPHGDVGYSRDVSFLELFYDLVYVVVIGQAAHHFADHPDWAGVRDFTVVFGLIWLAWFNGTLWHELHGREDGRSRLYIFAQMGLIALLAVFAGAAAGSDGTSFAIVYSVLFALLTWQWYVVQRIDRDPRYRPITTRYITAMLVTIAVAGATALVDDDSLRVGVWAIVVLAWVAGGLLLVNRDHTAGFGDGVTASLVERFGLFNIIVLGEVVIGVVNGIDAAPDRGPTTVAVGLLGLWIGIGLWSNYFGLLGRRIPGQRGNRLGGWIYAHLPLTAAIAMAGVALVNLVEHADDSRTPTPVAWLLSGSVAVVLAGIALAARALPDNEFPPGMTRHINPTLAAGCAALLLLAAVRLTPLVTVTAVGVLLSCTWLWLFIVFLACGGEVATDDAASPWRPADGSTRSSTFPSGQRPTAARPNDTESRRNRNGH
jgi:low temperature requirement protein LtrA